MDIILKKSELKGSLAIAISGSKSETNRLLLLQALFPEITLENVSRSDDSLAMTNALRSDSDVVDIGHAGTAMRFLTAYFATVDGRTITLTGSERMKQRPIKILVDALRGLGAQIDYMENEGFPPLRITGRKLSRNTISLDADISSQYVSALLLVAPKLEKGLKLTLVGEITSRPYVEMTLSLLNEIGVKTSFENNIIAISPGPSTVNRQMSIESDWSSASYFYSIVALSQIGAEIKMSYFKKNSFQGDRALVDIYKAFGVETRFEKNGSIILKKARHSESGDINLNLNDTPDLAQTIAVTAFGLGIPCRLSGLRTLKIKETDRIAALRNELAKLGAKVSVTDESIAVAPSAINENSIVATYEDHRMAMAFAALALKVPIAIRDAQVVSKSYPAFWDDLKSIGFTMRTS